MYQTEINVQHKENLSQLQKTKSFSSCMQVTENPRQQLAAVEEDEESSDYEVSVFKVEHIEAIQHNKKDNILYSWTS